MQIENTENQQENPSMEISIIDNIIWQGQDERINAIDFHPFCNIMVIGGSQQQYNNFGDDTENTDQGYIKVWEYVDKNQKKEKQFKFIRGLDGHEKCVNALRFSPDGKYLASASDDRKVKIWQLQQFTQFGNKGFQEFGWVVIKTLEGHSQEVLDLSWSNDSQYLVSAGFDQRSILWEVEKSRYITVLDGHKAAVKGVIFDPRTKFIISQGGDRKLKVYKDAKSTKKSTKKTLNFMIKNNIERIDYLNKQQPQTNQQQIQNLLQVPDDMMNEESQDISAVTCQSNTRIPQSFQCFIQENNIQSMVKRPAFSPDGSIFLAPAAQYTEQHNKKPFPCVLGYKRIQLQKPSLVIPTNDLPAVCIRFLNGLYKLKDGQEKILDQNYQMYYAIATTETVIIHSTQLAEPIAVFGNIHYALILDMSFMSDKILGICSTDGYCSFAYFDEGFFGERLTKEEIKEFDQELSEIIYKDSFYSEAQLKELSDNSIENNKEKSKQQEQIFDANIVKNQQQKIEVTDAQGNKKKRIIPVNINNISK